MTNQRLQKAGELKNVKVDVVKRRGMVDGKADFTMKTPASGAGAALALTTNSTQGEKKSINTEQMQACGGPLVNLVSAGTHHSGYFSPGHIEQPTLFKHTNEQGQVQSDPMKNVSNGDGIDIQLGLSLMPRSITMKGIMGSRDILSSKHTSRESKFSSNENPKQSKLSPNMFYDPFGIPKGTLGSIDCSRDNGSFKRGGTWVQQPPQLHRMQTFTRVYKRGAVGRSIDVTRYSGYEELKQDLARRFGIEGQVEDRQRIGWKFVYVDHEQDVLLVGEDPWEEFVSYVRCIKILSPQEVQQMSLDWDFADSIHSNQAFSSSVGILSLAYLSNRQNTALAESRFLDTTTSINNLNPPRLKSSREPNFQDGHRLKRPRQPGKPDEDSSDPDNIFRRTIPWLGDEFGWKNQKAFPGLSLSQWMDNPQYSWLAHNLLGRSFAQILRAGEVSQQLGLPVPQSPQQNRLEFNRQHLATSLQLDPHQNSPAISLSSINQPLHELSSTSSSNISQFRRLLRKVTYNIESISNNQPDLSSDASQDEEVQSHPRDKVSLGTEIDIQLGLSMMPHSFSMKEKFSSYLASGVGMLSSNEEPKKPQPELSLKMVSPSFGVPDLTMGSIDCTINYSSLKNRGTWPPQLGWPRVRTLTKVYKHGAVGISIEVTRYSGYEELKQDLARRFGIQGQVEDRQKVGWKFVWVDHEQDVLNLGDDPWEEFVDWVHCIRILSPQEVQQMSLD